MELETIGFSINQNHQESVSTYVDGNFKTNLDYDSAVSDEAPKGKIAFFGTRKTPKYQASL